MKTFRFINKNSSAILTLSAPNFEDAEQELFSLVKTDDWYVEDEDGDEDGEF